MPQAAEATLLKIRPFIRNINSSEYIEALANGDLCVAVGYNGDVLQARDRARDANKGIDIKYMVPKEGSISGSTCSPSRRTRRIPTARMPTSITSWSRRSSPTSAISSASPTPTWPRRPYVLESVKDDPAIYPPPQLREKLAVQLADSPEQTRLITRMWEKFKTGQ
jgi:putrescine transport system substrate-binding protein